MPECSVVKSAYGLRRRPHRSCQKTIESQLARDLELEILHTKRGFKFGGNDAAAWWAVPVQLEEQRAHTLAEEAAARARAAEELRMAEGAFPALGGALGAGAGGGGAGARVLSLVWQRVVVESYRVASSTRSKEVAEDGVPPCVPPPPREVQYMRLCRVCMHRAGGFEGRRGRGEVRRAASCAAWPIGSRGGTTGEGKGAGCGWAQNLLEFVLKW
ncbi:hypothetical protein EDB86DRAFT_2836178 [Lactarius hatsudake]|nr:hypothetical protein EDB86DRAFT_2836178 [Lactarius hatsudake]